MSVATEPRISILTFPQSFDGKRLHLNILVVPRMGTLWAGSPLAPLIDNFPSAGDTTPAFADAELRFQVNALDGFGNFPASAPIDFVATLPEADGVRPDARALFESLVAPGSGRFKLSAAAPRLAADVDGKILIQKYLPRTYRDAFLSGGPRTADAFTDDSYHCALTAKKGVNPAFVPSSDEVSWGEVIAFCLRHAPLARQLGLIRSASFPVDGTLFAKGGFAFVDLAPGSAYSAQVTADFDLLKRYASRIPALEQGKSRQVFGAVLFPVLNAIAGPAVPNGSYDEALIEAADYDAGYAKIVHGVQPVSQNLLAEEPDGFTPVVDLGIRLGWDDEQLLIWQNRQLKEDRTVRAVPGKPQRLDAPMGVFGYRIDARKHPETKWHSLVRVKGKGPLSIDDVALGNATHELQVEVHPMQLDGYQQTSKFWLPSYFCQWDGKSLVLPDEDAADLYKTEKDTSGAARLGRQYDPVGLDAIPLRYGETYDFRVRLMDPTGGGPTGDLPPTPDGLPSFATVPFLRHVVPEAVSITDLPVDNALFVADTLKVNRPLLGYPAVAFTGKYADPVARLKVAAAAAIGKASFGIFDPDVTHVRIDVEVRTLRMDNLGSLSGREPYMLYYTTHRRFPARLVDPCEIPLAWRDMPILTFGTPGDRGGGLTQAAIDAALELPLPTARDIRLTIRAVADEDPAYFAKDANVGKSLQLKVRRESTDERHLVASSRIRGIYLQPDAPPPWDGTRDGPLLHASSGESPDLIGRLAQELGVERKGTTLVGRKGTRVVFGCSRRIRHSLAPDHSSVTFAAKEDLINHWLVALTFELGRDWTWDNLDPISFELFRKKHFLSDAEIDDNDGKPVGDWELIPTAPMQALDGPQRGHTTLIFLDAVEPKSELMRPGDRSTRLPDVIELDYDVQPRFKSAPASRDLAAAFQFHLELPVTTAPAQVPQIASAGMALSKYQRSDDYSSTEARRKFLWLEMAEPIRDPHDRYFIRFLGYAPDPLLSDGRIETFAPPEETPLPVDPELIRIIPPGATDERSGLTAMVPLTLASNSKLHFLVPLPSALTSDAPELHGFFTYELRVGHADIWSTAQGRFGHPLRLTGVQHPAPVLFCTCERTQADLSVEAPYAMAVLRGKNVTHDPPRTELWALLYAQVRQADGKDFRNVLLDDRRLTVTPRLTGRFDVASGPHLLGFENRDSPARGSMHWTQAEILTALQTLGLPADSPLSVVCVETLPTVTNLQERSPGGGGRNDYLAASVVAYQAGYGDPAGGAAKDDGVRPLSDALGDVRILRTSPLTPVPGIC